VVVVKKEEEDPEEEERGAEVMHTLTNFETHTHTYTEV
jgi:hypothetical protein